MNGDDAEQPSSEQLQSECYIAAHDFAKRCYSYKEGGGRSEISPLDDAITFLVTELWDWTFSQAEITHAFENALAEMRRYAAGEERRI